MSYKVNFFARPVNSDQKLPWESLLIEFSLGVICTVMAIYGWNTGMALMAYPAGAVAVLSFGVLAYSLFGFFRDKMRTRQKRIWPASLTLAIYTVCGSKISRVYIYAIRRCGQMRIDVDIQIRINRHPTSKWRHNSLWLHNAPHQKSCGTFAANDWILLEYWVLKNWACN